MTRVFQIALRGEGNPPLWRGRNGKFCWGGGGGYQVVET